MLTLRAWMSNMNPMRIMTALLFNKLFLPNNSVKTILNVIYKAITV